MASSPKEHGSVVLEIILVPHIDSSDAEWIKTIREVQQLKQTPPLCMQLRLCLKLVKPHHIQPKKLFGQASCCRDS